MMKRVRGVSAIGSPRIIYIRQTTFSHISKNAIWQLHLTLFLMYIKSKCKIQIIYLQHENPHNSLTIAKSRFTFFHKQEAEYAETAHSA